MDQLNVLRQALQDETLVGKDEWPAYGMLKAILGEERTAKKERYLKRVMAFGCPYVDGSLCELDIIQRRFKWKDQVKVFAINASWRKAGSMEAALDKVPFGDADRMQAYMQTLEGRWFHIQDWDCASLRPIVKTKSVVRGLKPWIKFQFLIIRGCLKPWEQSAVDLSLWSPDEFIERYFFSGMEWHAVEMNKQGKPMTGNLVEKSYFNLKTKCVCLQFVPPPAA